MITQSKVGIVKLKHFTFTVSILPEPSSYAKAKGILEWENAMKIEFDALIRNNTWTLVPKPKDCKLISSKWLYQVKLKSDCSLDKHKSKVVVKGYK